MDYMNEKPAERMFDSWLGQHHITKAEYAAMSQDEKAKIQAEFQQYLKQKIQQEAGLTGSTDSAASSSTAAN
jgi:hypothetical protein